MRWRGGRRSTNIEDRRGGGIRRMPRGRAGRAGGLGGVGIVIALIAIFVFDVDPSLLLGSGDFQSEEVLDTPAQPVTEAERELQDFVSVVLADTEDVWGQLFAQAGGEYAEPKLVLFTDGVQSACGFAQSAVGPFYCPGDQKVYLDLSFFEELSRRFGAPGDFAQAYVIAHEVGHHVQTLLGISGQVHQAKASMERADANALQVRMELQADCLAGIWAHHADRARDILERGDVEEALGAANAIGDDTLQKRSQGFVVPDAFTHGTSAQRMEWFTRGLETGSVQACDTFN